MSEEGSSSEKVIDFPRIIDPDGKRRGNIGDIKPGHPSRNRPQQPPPEPGTVTQLPEPPKGK